VQEIAYTRPVEFLYYNEELKRYYSNTSDGYVSYDIPAALNWQTEKAADQGNKTFYYNAKLNVSVWKKPRVLAWEELPVKQLRKELWAIKRTSRYQKLIATLILGPLLAGFVYAVREQFREDPAWLTRPPVKERAKKVRPASELACSLCVVLIRRLFSTQVKMPRGSKYRNFTNRMSQDGKGGRSSN